MKMKESRRDFIKKSGSCALGMAAMATIVAVEAAAAMSKGMDKVISSSNKVAVVAEAAAETATS
jgi:hypothetical protein